MKTNIQAIKEMNEKELVWFLEDFRPCNTWIEITWSAMEGNEKAIALLEECKTLKGYDLIKSYDNKVYFEQIKDLEEFDYKAMMLWTSLPYRDL